MTDKELLEQLLTANKYKRIYLAICQKRQHEPLPPTQNKHHMHHILPKSMGGTNDPANLVRLTHREHLIAHRCLTKCTTGVNKKKMTHAAWFLVYKITETGRTSITSRTYDIILSAHRDACRLPKTAETKLKMSKPKTPEHREKQRLAGLKYWSRTDIPRVRTIGYKHTEETKQKLRLLAQTRKGQPKAKRSQIWKIPSSMLETTVRMSTTFTGILKQLQIHSSIRTLIERLDRDGIDYNHIKRGSGNHNHQ